MTALCMQIMKYSAFCIIARIFLYNIMHNINFMDSFFTFPFRLFFKPVFVKIGK